MTRVDAKSSLLNALDNAFPATGFAEFLQTALPEVDETEMDVETSLSWQGILARYLCAVFGKFSGLFPLEIPLHIGQHNAVSQALLLASLQATRKVKAYYSGDIQAAAAALNEQLEGITITDKTAEISKEDLERLQFSGFTLQEMIKSESLESDLPFGGVVNYIETLLIGLDAAAETIAEDVVEISDVALMGLKSLSRMIVSLVSGDE